MKPHSHKYYTDHLKMGDLINADYRLLLLLPRFGMELGFGEQTIEAACQSYHIDSNFFLMICNIHSFDDYFPSEQLVEKVNVCQLINYLSNSHQYFIKHRLQVIAEQLQVIIAHGKKSHGQILTQFFKEYEDEILKHFTYEEEIVFPYIKGMAVGVKNADYHIDIFEENHTNIDDKLSDLKNILIKYLPDQSALEERMNLIFNIFDFELDLNKHTLLENWILIPKVHKMEK